MRRAIHGVEVEVAGALPARLLAELLGAFPEGRPGTAPHLTVELQAAAGPPPTGGRPLFFHGVVQAVESGRAVVLSDGASTARVAPDGARIELAVAPASLAEPHTFEHVLALMALVVALRHRGLFHLHAAALVRPDGRAVLVAGGAGSGKSTLALALLEAAPGLRLLGDDTAFLARRAGGLAVLAFPRPLHLSDLTARAFPRLQPLLGDRYGTGNKRRLEPARAFPGREALEAAGPAAVILPRVTGSPRTELERIGAAEALGALIESSAHVAVDEMPGVEEQLALLAAAVDGASCLRIGLGLDLLERPGEVAREIVAEIA
jgi:hypothetical protein